MERSCDSCLFDPTSRPEFKRKGYGQVLEITPLSSRPTIRNPLSINGSAALPDDMFGKRRLKFHCALSKLRLA
jgi:hypothetical protein